MGSKRKNSRVPVQRFKTTGQSTLRSLLGGMSMQNWQDSPPMKNPDGRHWPIVCGIYSPHPTSEFSTSSREKRRRRGTISLSASQDRPHEEKERRQINIFLWKGILLSTQIHQTNYGRHSCWHDCNCRGYSQGGFHSVFVSVGLTR